MLIKKVYKIKPFVKQNEASSEFMEIQRRWDYGGEQGVRRGKWKYKPSAKKKTIIFIQNSY